MKEREDQVRGEKEPFLCLPHCLPARSLPLSSYLAVLPLTSSQGPLPFFASFVALPPSLSLFTSFCLAGIYSEKMAPPSSLHLPTFFPPWALPFPTFKHSIHQSSSSVPLVPSLHSYQNGCCGTMLLRFVCPF